MMTLTVQLLEETIFIAAKRGDFKAVRELQDTLKDFKAEIESAKSKVLLKQV